MTAGERPDPGDVNPATLELMFEHTKDSPGDQLRDSEQLDTKTTAVFAAATIAIGLAVRLPPVEAPRLQFIAGALTDHPKTFYPVVVDACIYLAALSWTLSAVATLLNLRTRSFYRTLQADDLWPAYCDHEPNQFRRILVRDAARAYRHNRDLLKRKAFFFNAAVLATGLEGLFIVAALTLSR